MLKSQTSWKAGCVVRDINNTSFDYSFLDEFNGNYLYEYAFILHGARKNFEAPEEQFSKRNKAFYIIWFVYKYLLNCNSAEEAYAYCNEETKKKYKLTAFFCNEWIFIGNNIFFHTKRYTEIKTVIDILYKKASYSEMIRLYIMNLPANNVKLLDKLKEQYMKFKIYEEGKDKEKWLKRILQK